jgi:L-rhamnose mutarotase
MQQDILESLWNFPQFIFKHLSMILKLTKSNMHNYIIWSRDSREQLFLELNLEQS